jgi:hypothetical protein
MGAAWRRLISGSGEFTEVIECHRGAVTPPEHKEDLVLDLLFIGLTIVVFAALWLLVKGVERLER